MAKFPLATSVLLIVCCLLSGLFVTHAWINRQSTEVLSRQGRSFAVVNQEWMLSVRGGATIAASDADVDEYDEEYDYEDDEKEEEDKALVKSTAKSVSKSKAMAKQATKAAVSATFSAMSKPKKSKKPKVFLLIPYIIRASLNPFTFVRMTKAYFTSLLDFGAPVQTSKNLRNAQQEEAKNQSSKKKSQPKKKMKPGQAKSLSDLPPLNT